MQNYLKNYKVYKVLFFLFLLPLILKAQNNNQIDSIQVGKPCPDYLFKNIHNYAVKNAHIYDFKGKWLILDLWWRGCSGCLAAFPHMNKLQETFKDKLVILQVGANDYVHDPNHQIKPFYEKFRQRLKLNMPFVFDSVFYKKQHVPVIGLIIIDDKGIVQAMPDQIFSQDIERFLAGKHPALVNDSTVTEIGFNTQKPFLVKGNGGTDSDFMFRSLLTRFKVGMKRSQPSDFVHMEKKGQFQVLGVPLCFLYYYAYFGNFGGINPNDSTFHNKFYNGLILETKDSSIFKFNGDYDFSKGNNMWCYSLIIPADLGSKERMMHIMQSNLNSYFGFEVSIETRKVPYLKLIMSDEAKRRLKTHGGQSFVHEEGYGPVTARNWAFKDFFKSLQNSYHGTGDYIHRMDIIDETGMIDNIDITMDCVFTDFDDVTKALVKNGFQLVQGEKEMKAIVIKDPQTPQYSGIN